MLSLHRLAGDIFECGRSFFKFKIKTYMVFFFKNVEAAFKTTSRERRKTASLFTRVEARTESTAQRRRLRRSPWYLKHGHCDQRSYPSRIKKRRSSKRRRVYASFWAGLGG